MDFLWFPFPVDVWKSMPKQLSERMKVLRIFLKIHQISDRIELKNDKEILIWIHSNISVMWLGNYSCHLLEIVLCKRNWLANWSITTAPNHYLTLLFLKEEPTEWWSASQSRWSMLKMRHSTCFLMIIILMNASHFWSIDIHLSSLHLLHHSIHGSEFRQLTAAQKDLVELTLELSYSREMVRGSLSDEKILQFPRSHANVEQLNFINYPKSMKIELQNQLRHDWNIRINGKGLFFKRKTVTQFWIQNRHTSYEV